MDRELLLKGKIIKGIGGFYYVHDGMGSVYECRAKGIFRNRDEKPLVGDNVLFSVTDEEKKIGRVDELLPRKNAVIRPAVANCDQALILVTAAAPAFHPGLLDRFLLWMEWQEIPTVIGINKIDLDTENKRSEIEAIYGPAGYPVRCFSCRTGEGTQELREILLGKTTVLAGASGVGKSSLLNCLVPEALMETGMLSRKLERGRHTTRHSEFFFMTEDTYLLDTPGFTSLMAPETEEYELKHYFPEFLKPAELCRFPDCVHVGEKECGVKAAVAAGTIPASRYESYLQVYDERKNRRRFS